MIQLNYRDSRPIYEQIRDGLRSLIISGALGKDEKLPSVRSMAAELAINPNTIQRAYADLEAQGYIYSVPGKGSFAAGGETLSDTRKEELLEKLREIIRELGYLGVSRAELVTILEEGEKT